MIAMARGPGLRVVAEGVETDAHFDFVRKQRCDLFQGSVSRRPVPLKALRKLLTGGKPPFQTRRGNGGRAGRREEMLLDEGAPRRRSGRELRATGQNRLLSARK
jgi:hypothetical protein